MSKGYKKEYINKVKEKFNDLQSTRDKNSNTASKSSNDSRSNVFKSNGVVVPR